MAIVETLNLNDFMDAFKRMDRDYFSYEGYERLFEFYEQISEETGEPFEMDVIAICCDWVEYEDIDGFISEYSNICPKDEDEEDEDYRERFLKAADDHTYVIRLNGGGYLVERF